MTWAVGFDRDRIDLHTPNRISEEDAQRQSATVEEILRRLEAQPGLILADEVGMGKTFVALAVAVSVAWARPEADPVVVMVPPSLKDKWPRDCEVFRAKCLRRQGDRSTRQLRIGRADTGLDFFRLLDDPKSRRSHIIFLSHGALSRGLSDPWTKLAILQAALKEPALEQHVRVFHRFAGALLQVGSRLPDDEVFRNLLSTPTREWRAILRQYGELLDDDPVPTGIDEILLRGEVDLRPLSQALKSLPLRWSEYLKDRLTDLRRELKGPLGEVWHRLLTHASFRSPLLILDEAHHLKNPATQLASLFVAPEAEDEAGLLDGALRGRFERMLFLTATPFQLGHSELLNVLDRFRGIHWQADNPRLTFEDFGAKMATLASTLDEAQFAAAALDTKWSLLTPDHVAASGDNLETWWRAAIAHPENYGEKMLVVARAYSAARQRLSMAEGLLRPWVIRHTRPRSFGRGGEKRRRLLTGGAIASPEPSDAGLPVGDSALLPFLLAARCEAALTSRTTEILLQRTGRTVFAEGLASSYEAYLDTRKPTDGLGEHLLIEEEGGAPSFDDGGVDPQWYMSRLQRALPDLTSYQDHPKIRPTVAEAVRLWRAGEKVLVFCHFRQTGRSLRAHLSAALDLYIKQKAAQKLGCSVDDVNRELESVGRLFDSRRPLYRQLTEIFDSITGAYPELGADDRVRIEEVVRRFVRTPSFLVRYFPLGQSRRAGLLADAFAQPDESGVSLRDKLERFVEFIARRCDVPERDEYLTALDAIQTGLRYTREPGAEHKTLLPNVQLANGEVSHDQRRRLLLAFNAPFFPEILIASSVLAEGVDLHLECRYVIHHDLSWNPSTLEQRTGRVDRIGCKAEQVTKPVNIYLPFIGGTQDEKMYRVVRDRERWFQVVMGERYSLDELALERMANRLPLPEEAAQELAFRLEVYKAQGAGSA